MLVLAGPARAATLTVTNTDNSGPGSLRAAIETANGNGEADTITFAPDLAGTVALTSGQLTIDSDLTIEGPGAGKLSVSGKDNSRIFSVASGSEVKISDLTITAGNTDGGGGINNKGTLTLTDSAISDNKAGSFGGGIANTRGTLTVTRSTISGNTADDDVGGGISNKGSATNSGDVTINNSTISGNTSEGSGGGIANDSKATINNSTITKNTAEGPGTGVASLRTGATRVFSSIIVGNGNSDVDTVGSGSFASQGYNLIGDGKATGAFNNTGDQTGVANPGLGPLADNGGPTQTHTLKDGSPALDKGDGGRLTRDQRGETRPVDLPNVDNAKGGDGSDVGSLERQDGAGGGSSRCTITGTKGDDILRGTPDDDVICGFGGNDTIRGGPGKDELLGGLGKDEVYGGSSSDRIFGGGGDDFLSGNRGMDRIFAGRGLDRLSGGDGHDLLGARDGRPKDRLFGGKNQDTCRADRRDITKSCAR